MEICHCGTCNVCVPTGREEHRGSRPIMDSDPTFADAAFREFTPEQAEMLRQKAEGS